VTSPNDFNRQIVEEFRANGGKVGGMFAGRNMLLLTTTGAKSGTRRTTPLVYQPDGDRWLIFASKGGAPTSPAWYHNLVAHPDTTIEVGSETVPVTAKVLRGEERDKFYAKQVEQVPVFGEYQQKTSRTIPVVALERRKS
jgi:deazaflavin-dependent oxidoreductase (nitroreductase family)